MTIHRAKWMNDSSRIVPGRPGKITFRTRSCVLATIKTRSSHSAPPGGHRYHGRTGEKIVIARARPWRFDSGSSSKSGGISPAPPGVSSSRASAAVISGPELLPAFATRGHVTLSQSWGHLKALRAWREAGLGMEGGTVEPPPCTPSRAAEPIGATATA